MNDLLNNYIHFMNKYIQIIEYYSIPYGRTISRVAHPLSSISFDGPWQPGRTVSLAFSLIELLSCTLDSRQLRHMWMMGTD